jgi:general secretion pathway protein A
MYNQYFSLKQSPFSIAPDPRYLFMSERHREALAHLLYGIGSGGGFVLLTGEIGAGKTTVCRCFMEQIPENCKLAYIFNPKLSVEELLLSICDEFGIVLPPHGAGPVSVKVYVDAINAYLLESHAQGKNNVLVIDEAQNLSAEVLEQLRLLTNLETSERKLLQIILIGQPELRGMLARPELEQLAQRVIARYHLGSLSEPETGQYIEHRLAVAGATALAPLPRGLTGAVHKLSKGVPRRINLLCDRALLGAYVENQPQVTRQILRKAAEEVFAEEGGQRPAPRAWQIAAAGVLVGVAISGAAAWRLTPSANAPASVPVRASAPAAAVTPAASAAKPATAAQASPAGTVQAAAVAPASVAAAMAPTAAPVEAPAVRNEEALRALAALWGQSSLEGDVCQAAAKQNLRCLQSKGDLDDLRLLDRPAVLTLHDDPTTPSYALLTAISGKQATLTVAGKQQTISLDALAARFDGQYTTFWRAPRSWRDEVSLGDHGPDVDWLAKRLAQLDGAKKPQENQPLDASVQRRLIAFQTAQHLKADGVAGPKTFIRLNQLGGVQEPRLLASAGK